RDVPILTKSAMKIAPRRAERKHRAARQEMIQRLLLDGIDAEARRASIGREHHRIAHARAHEAGAALALVQLAVARAQVALDAAIIERVPPAAGMERAFELLVDPCGHLNFSTVYRDSRMSGCQKRAGNPAFCRRWARNSMGSGRLSHTCGRNVAR